MFRGAGVLDGHRLAQGAPSTGVAVFLDGVFSATVGVLCVDEKSGIQVVGQEVWLPAGREIRPRPANSHSVICRPGAQLLKARLGRRRQTRFVGRKFSGDGGRFDQAGMTGRQSRSHRRWSVRRRPAAVLAAIVCADERASWRCCRAGIRTLG